MRKMLAGRLILSAVVSTGGSALAASPNSMLCPEVTDGTINRAASADGSYIAAGWGATNRYGYAERFRDLVQENEEEITLNNIARAGLTSCGLLTQVTVDSTTRDALAGARVVSISVGGNDLLSCARDNYATIDELCAVTALARFQRNWPEILEHLPIPDDGRLLAMTIYNPYPPDAAGAKEADIYISKMNAIIRSNVSQAYNVTMVDVYTRFRGWTADGDWRGCAWTGFCEARRDVHPNDLGYDELADLHWQAYAESTSQPEPTPPAKDG